MSPPSSSGSAPAAAGVPAPPAPTACSSAARPFPLVSSRHVRVRALYTSGGGCPAFVAEKCPVGAKYVAITAVANRPACAISVNSAFIRFTNRAWSTKFTYRRISDRSESATAATDAPCPATSATITRLIRPVPHDDT